MGWLSAQGSPEQQGWIPTGSNQSGAQLDEMKRNLRDAGISTNPSGRGAKTWDQGGIPSTQIRSHLTDLALPLITLGSTWPSFSD